MSDAKQLVEQIAAEAETTRDQPMPPGTVYTRPNRAKSVMFSLRLNPDELAAVQQLAGERDVPVTALVRGWIVQRLAGERNAPTDTATVIERLEADVRALRRLLTS